GKIKYSKPATDTAGSCPTPRRPIVAGQRRVPLSHDGAPRPSARCSALLVVEAAAALDPEPPLVDVFPQQPAGPFGDARANRRVVLLDRQYDIEADAIHEPERGDPGRGEDLPHLVDVLRSGHALLDHHQALALDRRPDAVEDEPVTLPAHPERHQPVPGKPLHQRGDDALVGATA